MSTPPSSPPQSILRPSSIKISQSDYYKLTYIFLFKVFCSLHANKYVEACHVCNNLYAVISKVRSVKPTNWPRKKFAISLSVDISRIFKMFFCIQTIFDCKKQCYWMNLNNGHFHLLHFRAQFICITYYTYLVVYYQCKY